MNARPTYLLALFVVASSLSWATVARGVSFLTELDSSYLPSYDPDGSRLRALVNSVSDRYSAIIKDDWPIGLQFGYRQIAGGAPIAGATMLTSVDWEPGKPRILQGEIWFNATVDWFIDSTPTLDEEYLLSRTLYQSLPEGSQQARFEGNVPYNLEVDYSGVNSDQLGVDMVTVALHELGHLLGIAAGPEVDTDFDFDFAPEFVHGQSVAAKVSPDNRQHLINRSLLHAAPRSIRARTLPSAVDIFAMAAASGWEEIDLPHKEFWGGSVWNEPINWSGGRLPEADDTVTLRAGVDVALTDPAFARELSLLSESNLSTAGHKLSLEQLTVHEGGTLLHQQSVITGNRADFHTGAVYAPATHEGKNPTAIFLEKAHLAGTLDLSHVVETVSGERFSLLVSSQIVGDFDQIVGNRGASKQLLIEYGSISAELEAVQLLATIPGDTTGDGVVDQSDLDSILLAWGQHVKAGVVGSGDLSGDGRIDQADLDAVLLNWGNRLQSNTTAAASIPEPATAWLMIACVCGAVAALRTKFAA